MVEASGLYSEIDSADAAPTAAQSAALSKIARDYPAVMERWNKIKSADIAAINRELKSANLTRDSAQLQTGRGRG